MADGVWYCSRDMILLPREAQSGKTGSEREREGERGGRKAISLTPHHVRAIIAFGNLFFCHLVILISTVGGSSPDIVRAFFFLPSTHDTE
jgi:hypothetical protein